MPVNTITLNQQRQPLDHLNTVWLFGYGSLIYKADFPYLACRPVFMAGSAASGKVRTITVVRQRHQAGLLLWWKRPVSAVSVWRIR